MNIRAGRTALRLALAVPLVGFFFLQTDAFAQAKGTLRLLFAAYRCEVVARLERIYQTGNPAVDRDRFLAVTVTAHPHGYVQCMFYDNRASLICEASSGYYTTKPARPRTYWLPPQSIEALERLGFSTDDSKGNFRHGRDVASPPDFNAIADLILTALHDAYGARADSKLKFNAPFAPGQPTSCVPVS
jgi:type III secretion system-like peptide-binding chaperone